MILLNSSRLSSLKTRFRKEADSSFIEAKRAMTATVTQIPWWFVALTLALGWNELMAVLRSPLFFLTLAVLASSVYLIYSLGLSKTFLSISYSTIQAAIKESAIYLKAKGIDLDEFVDGSIFNRWMDLAREFSNSSSAAQNNEIEMEPIDDKNLEKK